jgi:hypothetical protein
MGCAWRDYQELTFFYLTQDGNARSCTVCDDDIRHGPTCTELADMHRSVAYPTSALSCTKSAGRMWIALPVRPCFRGFAVVRA